MNPAGGVSAHDCAVAAIRYDVTMNADDARGIAYEMLSKQSDLWRHGIVLCLPADKSAMNARTVMTELGTGIHFLF